LNFSFVNQDESLHVCPQRHNARNASKEDQTAEQFQLLPKVIAISNS
jgi:hypothetical protein